MPCHNTVLNIFIYVENERFLAYLLCNTFLLFRFALRLNAECRRWSNCLHTHRHTVLHLGHGVRKRAFRVTIFASPAVNSVKIMLFYLTTSHNEQNRIQQITECFHMFGVCCMLWNTNSEYEIAYSANKKMEIEIKPTDAVFHLASLLAVNIRTSKAFLIFCCDTKIMQCSRMIRQAPNWLTMLHSTMVW